MRELIAEAIDVVAFLTRDPHIGPKLSELVAVDGIHESKYAFRNLKETNLKGVIAWKQNQKYPVMCV